MEHLTDTQDLKLVNLRILFWFTQSRLTKPKPNYPFADRKLNLKEKIP